MTPLDRCTGSHSPAPGWKPAEPRGPAVRAQCPACGKRITVNVQGRLRAHGTRGKQTDGS